MKQIVVLSFFAFTLCACSGNKKQAEIPMISFDLDQMMAIADRNVDSTLTVIGYVTHTCKHSGKRCFIVGESQKTSLRIESGGEIESFSPELIGSKLAVTGTLKEFHLSGESIDKMENNVKQLEQEEGMAETCAAELSNISEMRQWMKDNGKSYYVIYYMDGLKYKIIDN